MPSQFDQVMARLTEIERLVRAIYKHQKEQIDGPQPLFGEDPINEEEFRTAYEHGQALPDESGMDSDILPTTVVDRPKMPGATRRLVEVKGVDGNIKTVSRDELDPRILQVLDASIKAGTFWFLYERESDGQIMISAEERVVNQVGRGAVPAEANEPDLSE